MRKPKRRSISYNLYLENDERPGHASVFAGMVTIALIMIIVRNTEASYGIPVICFSSMIFFLFVALYLVFSLRMQLLYQPYSYNCIYYSGFSMFMFSISLTNFNMLLRYLCEPGRMDEIHELLNGFMKSACFYLLISAPFLIMFALALTFTNIQLIRKEGRRFVNILGIILSFLLISGYALIAVFVRCVSGTSVYIDCAGNVFAAVVLYFECMLIGAIIMNGITVSFLVPDDVEAIIVLGCGIRKDGTPTPLLRDRVDRAIRVYRDQIRNTGAHPCFVVSGGQGPDEIISEAASMRDYLLSQGIPEEDILMEDKSVSTYENMKFSKKLIGEQVRIPPENRHKKIPGKRPRIVFVTSNYHVFRSGVIATDVGITAAGVSAKTKWYFWPNAAVREFAGLLSRQRKKQAVILILMITLFIVATVMHYMMIK